MDKTKEFLALAAVVLTIATGAYIYNYYAVIGINIFAYLEASEILLLQFNSLVHTGLMLVLSLLMLAAIANHSILPAPAAGATPQPEEAGNVIPALDKASLEDVEMFKRLEAFFASALKIVVAATIIVGATYFVLCYTYPTEVRILLDFSLDGVMACLGLALTKAAVTSFKKVRATFPPDDLFAKSLKKTTIFLLLAALSLVLVTFVGLIGRFDMYTKITDVTGKSGDRIVRQGAILTVAELPEKKIITNDTLIYVGRTQKFVFLYQKASGEAYIIPSDKILQLRLRQQKITLIIPPSYQRPRTKHID